MKKGKEMKMDLFGNYNIVYGSVNNNNPKALYISLSTWAQPRNDSDENYGRLIKDIGKRLRQSLYNILSADTETEFIKERSIVDLDMRESGVKYGKRSFMNCEITLFMKREIPVNSDKMRLILNEREMKKGHSYISLKVI
jgi:hypothetical protein